MVGPVLDIECTKVYFCTSNPYLEHWRLSSISKVMQKPQNFESCVNLKLLKLWGSTSYLNVLVSFYFPKMST